MKSQVPIDWNTMEVSFTDIPRDSLSEIFTKYMKVSRNLDGFLLLEKECRSIGFDMLKYIKWDPVLLENGKVKLDTLISICSYPELRTKAIRYVEGKSVFIYKNILLQVNHPKNITTLDIFCNKVHIKCTSDKYRNSKFPINVWGISIFIQDSHSWAPRLQYDLPYLDICHICRFLGKIKTNMPAEFQTYMQSFSKAVERVSRDLPQRRWIWISQYDEYLPRNEMNTISLYY